MRNWFFKGLSFRNCIVIVLLLLSVFVYHKDSNAQQPYHNVIKGRVFDIDNGLPLGGVNVYLSNTTIGDATDTLGTYKISNISPGNYDLVYQFVGYEKLVTNIDIGRRDTLHYEARLKYTPYKLDSLVVTGERDRLWIRNSERFKRHFIGSSNNAKQTEIVNAEVLNSEYKGFGMYTASSEREIHIINKALGYESFVDLVHYEWNFYDDTGQAYYNVRIMELEPESEKQRKEWELKRRRTYDESIRKFFAGLLYTAEILPNDKRKYIDGLLSLEEVTYEGNNYKILNGTIQKLENEEEFEQYQPKNDAYEVFGFRVIEHLGESPVWILPEHIDRSFLDAYNSDSGTYIIVIDENGHLLNPLEIEINGHWAKFRFADFLPLNYQPNSN